MVHVEKCVSRLSCIPLPHHPVPISRGKQYMDELSAPLDVSKGCEALCPEEVEDYGFL